MLSFVTRTGAVVLGCLSFANALSVSSKILIIARDSTAAANAYSGLQGYGIPYEILTVPSSGATLPTLSSGGSGNYGGIVVLGEVSYQYDSGFNSALTAAQWQSLYDYQSAFGVRMARIDVYPGPNFGAKTAIDGAGCCDTGVEQLISITNSTSFPNAGMKIGATVSSQGLWHYPAVITDTNTTWEIASFAAGGSFTSKTTAAVVNKFANGNGTREQMVWFTSWALDWNAPSTYLQHSWIHFVTRGLFTGFRRLYFSTQIDDVMLDTDLYSPANTTYRIKPADLEQHKTWTTTINKKMPAGSNYFIELGHNGNGNIIVSTIKDTKDICQPTEAIYYDQDYTGTLEFQKPLGTGDDLWPTTPTSFQWKTACTQLDDLLVWVTKAENLNVFAHMSHTFTHEALNNATFSDTNKEITWNQAWLKLVGIDAATKFSANGLIPPAITGMHNGDAIKAFLDNGIKYVVGDNTRPVLMNSENSFWPLTSTVAANGYDGLEIVPRWATTIYFNCDTADCTLTEWIKTSAGSGDFDYLLENAKVVNTRHLLGLHNDPFMFHQANLRYNDINTTVTINGETAKRSLLQSWVETIVQEIARLTTWPMVTLKHDDLAKAFINRRTRDQCNPALTWTYSADGKSVTGATVTAGTTNTCSAPIPVTFPGKVTSNNGGTAEQLGADPLTVWVTLSGSPVTFTLSSPVSVW